MPHVFEIVAKDGAGRVGKLHTSHGVVETPAFVPVINPHLPVVSLDDLKKLGFDLFITNAYLIYKDEKLRELVLRKGIHGAFNWDKAIMTDSGAFQLMVYGDVEVSNLEIIDFQSKIGVDIGVILDIPIYKGSIDYRKRFIDETIRRAKEAYEAGYVTEDSKTIWVGPIHGVPYPSLLEYSVEHMTKYPFSMYAVGSIVPLMESYQLIQLIKSAVIVKSRLPTNYPVHLFGAGHPAMFALFVLVGFDTFDSAAYALYAKDNRYLTPYGTYHLKELRYFPCDCPICTTYTPQELLSMDSMHRQHLLAMHNLYVAQAEIRRIKQAIHEGTLWQLVAKRASSHPEIARAYKWLLDKRNLRAYNLFEELEPAFKNRGLMITRDEELYLPVVRRYRDRIFERILIWSDKVIISTPEGSNDLPSLLGAQVLIINPVFYIIPREIRNAYPLFQHMSPYTGINENALEFVRKFIEYLMEKGVEEIYVYDTREDNARKIAEKLGVSEIYEGQDVGILSQEKEELLRVKAFLRYQFGPGAEDVIEKAEIEYSPSTGRPRKIFAADITQEEIENVIIPEIEKHVEKRKKLGKPVPEDPFKEMFIEKGRIWLLAAIAPTYFKLVPHPLLAYRMWKKFRDELRYTVVVNKEAEPFVRAGRTIFSKFIIELDDNIRANDEVFVLNEEKDLIAYGRAIISAREMRDFKRGAAIENRWGFRER
ncbi:MAG: tRNA guanosine(15) transglycosylase TgtA [Candidatus Njordarchaeales archaeon]